MTDQKMFPKMKWPETAEGKDKTYVKLTKLPSPLPTDFFEVPVRKGATREGSIRNYVFSPREKLVHFLTRNFYDETRENRDRVEFLLRPLDLTPAAIPFASYDTTRAIGEGRYKDAILPGITAGAPFLGKTAKMMTAGKSVPADDAANATDLLQARPITGLFDPIPKPQRPLIDDYPGNRVKVDEDGYIMEDMEGRPIRAPYVAGRTRIDEPDHRLTPYNMQRVGEYAIEGPIDEVPSSKLGEGVLGRTDLFLGLPMRLSVLDSLPQIQKQRVKAHEASHAVDALANQIPTKGLERELNFNYSALTTGEERTHNLVKPRDFGYRSKHLSDREKIAEAIRAYMTDPNYFKTVAPMTARRIREYVFNSPELSKIIQFNSIAAAGALALGGMGQSDDANAMGGEAKQPNTYGLAKLAKALSQRGLYPQTPVNERFRSLVQILANLKAKQASPASGGPR